MSMEDNKRKKVCFAASSGGHMAQLMMLKPLMDEYDSILVTEKTNGKETYEIKTYYLDQVNRKEKKCFWYMLCNAKRSWDILRKEKPEVVVTTGVLAVIPLCLMAKLRGSKLIYIESFAKVNTGTMTGRFLYYVADVFFVQWKTMLKVYPKAEYMGGLY